MSDEGPNKGSPWKLLQGSSHLIAALRDRKSGLWSELNELRLEGTVLSGDLGEIPPSELLNFLDQGRRTGVLLTRVGDVERALAMVDGDIAWACSTSPGERLGELLARMGMADRARIDGALAEQGASGRSGHRRIGELLVEKGVLAPDEVARGLRHQCMEIFLGLLVARSGSFVFLRGIDPSALPVVLELDTQAMLLDGLRRLDEMELYRTRVPGGDAVLHPTGKPVHESLPPEARQILALADGARTLSDLAAASALGEFEATKAAFRLIEQGFLRL
jgi:hypothetical protein